jgi:hypothetical protein
MYLKKILGISLGLVTVIMSVESFNILERVLSVRKKYLWFDDKISDFFIAIAYGGFISSPILSLMYISKEMLKN